MREAASHEPSGAEWQASAARPDPHGHDSVRRGPYTRRSRLHAPKRITRFRRGKFPRDAVKSAHPIVSLSQLALPPSE